MNRAEKLFEIFQEAVESERQARARYEEAAGLCEDEGLRQVLLAFAEDELRHEREILARFKEVSEKAGGGLH